MGDVKEVVEYRKTATIKAVQYLGQHVGGVCTGGQCCKSRGAPDESVPHIHTLEGDLTVSHGDWVATGVKGEHWAIKPDVFAASYEPVDDRPASTGKGEGWGPERDFVLRVARLTHSQDDGASYSDDPGDAEAVVDLLIAEARDLLALPVPPFKGGGNQGDFKALANRFLGWPIPPSVRSDRCMSMTHAEYPHPRSGTSMMGPDEAENMLRYVLGEALPEDVRSGR